MIGVYDYTVIATYFSLLLGIRGIVYAMDEHLFAATVCLMAAGLLDAFDGRIARTKKNRTDTQRQFGIQIDSLNDLICFGVLPAAIGCSFGERSVWFLSAMAFFTLAALIRLAYFNVSEEERQSTTGGKRHYYLGVPVTTTAFLVPLFWLIPWRFDWKLSHFFAAALFLLGVLFISPVKIKKPELPGIIAMGIVGLAEVWLMLDTMQLV